MVGDLPRIGEIPVNPPTKLPVVKEDWVCAETLEEWEVNRAARREKGGAALDVGEEVVKIGRAHV